MQRARGKRGRPQKFGRPSQIVALTLPAEVIRGLRRIDDDIAWAIVHMFERDTPPPQADNGRQPDAELVTIGEGRSLIVVNRKIFRHLPGVHIIPISDTRATALDAANAIQSATSAAQSFTTSRSRWEVPRRRRARWRGTSRSAAICLERPPR